MIVINADRSVSVKGDTTVGPYDGGDDTLVGVQNNSSKSVDAITVSGPAGSGIFGFDGDGLCTYVSVTCGSTGYEGPNTAFVSDPANSDHGEVDFNPHGLAANGQGYFSLEGVLTAASLTVRQGHLTRRYVALGDSIPYGHGLANPGFKPQSGLPPQQGPSGSAYPSSLARSLGLTLNVRDKGCTLTGDQLSVSGAASTRANTDGRDVDCPDRIIGPVGISKSPHKAVDPEELSAASLSANPPALVTVQVGADDINFVNCFGDMLHAQLDPLVPTESCFKYNFFGIFGKKLELSDEVKQDLKGLATGLDGILKSVESSAPHASIVVVNYYQPLPSDPKKLTGGGVICGDAKTQSRIGLYGELYRQASLLLQSLNDTISSVVHNGSHNEVILSDISQTMKGHEMCTASPWLFNETWRAVHPIAAGQDAIFRAIAGACLADSKQAGHTGCTGR